MDRGFGKLQIASAAVCSLGHGMNDAQKTMGINALAGSIVRAWVLTIPLSALLAAGGYEPMLLLTA